MSGPSPRLLNEPPQPPESDWRFIASLKAPLWTSIPFRRSRPRRSEVSIREGISIQALFPDPTGVLETAYSDLHRFFGAAGISREGAYPIVVRHGKTESYEAYRVEISRDSCTITANDSEGARRGIFFLQDEMLRTGGPFLPLGVTERQPQIRTRLSRCFFGPINRPPKHRDELTDEVDYYPDEYLNRLAHQGINGLWLTINFRDLCPSRFFPTHGLDSERRLEKLRRTVAKCARYGIRIYAFCIEPKAFGDILPDALNPLSDLAGNPEMGGHSVGGITCFCPSSPTSQAYLEESAYHLFTQVPGLGGMMNINLGEAPTHCLWFMPWYIGTNTCPRCSTRKPWEVFHDLLLPLHRGMHKANPQAELISWLYVPKFPDRKERRLPGTEKMLVELAEKFPKEAILQVNFESMGAITQLGKKRIVRDYSLAYVGPSHLFAACAQARKRQGARISAKIQAACSHEVATVPFVPAPGNLFRKYRKMHRLGVTDVMQSWYFGNYPSLMTKAAGELAFAPLPTTEKAFLRRLAAIGWADDGPTVARAWSLFSEGYRHFPANLLFAWYGPLHDAAAWPLHLKPVDAPIAPSWLLNYAASGDRIGECIGFEHRLEEVILLLEKMWDKWQKGLQLLLPLITKYHGSEEHVQELGVAQAMGLQISSALNVLKFYAERENLYGNGPAQTRLQSLGVLRELTTQEIGNSTALEKLALADPRLGFHSEAEGYKYFPAKLRWRSQMLHNLLHGDFPEMERLLLAGAALPSPYRPEAEEVSYECRRVTKLPKDKQWQEIPVVHLYAAEGCAPEGYQTEWQAVHDGRNLHFRITCSIPPTAPPQEPLPYFPGGDLLRLSVEPRRFWPTRDFSIGSFGGEYFDSKEIPLDHRWKSKVSRNASGWQAMVTISLKFVSTPFFRLNLARVVPDIGIQNWIARHPAPGRLIFGDANPADLGWLHLQG